MPDTLERRRSRRATVERPARGESATCVPVRLLDISRSGVLLAGPHPIHVSQQAELRAALDGRPFHATVEARRVEVEGPGAPVRIGVRFLALDEDSERALRLFLRRSLD